MQNNGESYFAVPENLRWENVARNTVNYIGLFFDSSSAPTLSNVGRYRNVADGSNSQWHSGGADVVDRRRRKQRAEETELRPNRWNKETAAHEEYQPTCAY